MGQIVKQVSEHSTRYYWYPGDKKEWVRAGLAAGIGVVAFGILSIFTHNLLIAVTVGTTITAGLAGLNFGRRDFRATHGFPEVSGKAARRAAVLHGSRAAWRGMVQGFGGAMAAVLIANMPATGFIANWLLPIVPAVTGALTHQAGMLYERLVQAATPSNLRPIPAKAGGATPAKDSPAKDSSAAPAKQPVAGAARKLPVAGAAKEPATAAKPAAPAKGPAFAPAKLPAAAPAKGPAVSAAPAVPVSAEPAGLRAMAGVAVVPGLTGAASAMSAMPGLAGADNAPASSDGPTGPATPDTPERSMIISTRP